MLATKLSTKEQLDEKLLLQQIAAGDYEAFTQLYELSVAELLNYAAKFTNDVQVIEDCIHDTFVWLWNHRDQLTINYSIKGYLFKCIRTSVLKRLQKLNKLEVYSDVHDNNAITFLASAEEKYINTEDDFFLKEKMANVLGLLTPKQKEIIYLRFYQGLSFSEIAANMNLTTKACYKLMGRAISELRKVCPQSLQLIILFFSLFSKIVG